MKEEITPAIIKIIKYFELNDNKILHIKICGIQ